MAKVGTLIILALLLSPVFVQAGETVKYSEYFLPPHVEAKYELKKIQEEWRDQELATLILKQEEADSEE